MVLLGISGIYIIYGLNALIYISHAISFTPNMFRKRTYFQKHHASSSASSPQTRARVHILAKD